MKTLWRNIDIEVIDFERNCCNLLTSNLGYQMIIQQLLFIDKISPTPHPKCGLPSVLQVSTFSLSLPSIVLFPPPPPTIASPSCRFEHNWSDGHLQLQLLTYYTTARMRRVFQACAPLAISLFLQLLSIYSSSPLSVCLSSSFGVQLFPHKKTVHWPPTESREGWDAQPRWQSSNALQLWVQSGVPI